MKGNKSEIVLVSKDSEIERRRKSGLDEWCGQVIRIGVLLLLSGVVLFCTVILFPLGFFLAAIGALAVILGTAAYLVLDFSHWFNRHKLHSLSEN